MQKQKVKALSGGERNRLLLARVFLEGANVLVLDEPTNDLDLVTLNVLERLLVQFPGAVLLVTHDRYFLDKVATSILAFEGDGQRRALRGQLVDVHSGCARRPASPQWPKKRSARR
jgi:ATP-binding cassette subfamily F protein uup